MGASSRSSSYGGVAVGDDIDDLWGAVNELRSAVAELTSLVREVRAMLTERCEARSQRLERVEAEQSRQRISIQELREHRSFSRGQQAAMVAIGSVLAGFIGAIAGPIASHFLGGK